MTKKRNAHGKLRSKGIKFGALALLGSLMLIFSTPLAAQAHCDSADGPVVTAAKQALEKNDVNLAFPYVGPQYEKEVAIAFDKAMAGGTAGGEAKAVAEIYFAETTVRLHRATENAPYNGIQPAGQNYGPALPAAEKAIETGNTEELKKVLNEAVSKQVDEQYRNVTAKKVEPNASVNDKRESIEAQFGFEKYALGLYESAMGKKVATGDSHGEGATASGPAEGEVKAAEPIDKGSNNAQLGLAGAGILGLGALMGRLTKNLGRKRVRT